MYKTTVPKRFVDHGPENIKGFFKCKAPRCDTCKHGHFADHVISSDERRRQINQHISCTKPNVVYLLTCKLHPKAQYVGCTYDLKKRWANHKSDCKLKKSTKCSVAAHVSSTYHPHDDNLSFLQVTALEQVKKTEDLKRRELYWMCNFGTVFTGLNSRNDVHGFTL